MNNMMSMDSVFNNLGDTARAGFLRSMMGSLFGCSYICLWSYLPINTCLIFKDGCYNQDQEPTSSSSGGPTLASRLFDQYCHQSIFLLHQNDFVPGFAFQHNLPYMEINDMNLLGMASSDVQRQFYQEARIKKSVFLGCNSGEIELGFFIVNPQIHMEMEMRSLFPDDFSRQQQPGVAGDQLPRPPADPNTHNSSSSSSFRSLSTESPEYSSLVFNINNPSATVTTSYNVNIPETALVRPMSADPIQEAAIQALSRFRSPRLPTLESEHAQMTRAILAVLSSSPPEASSSLPNQNVLRNPNVTAFEKYSGSAGPTRSRIGGARTTASMFKRSISYFRSLNAARMSQLMQSPQGHNRPSATQIHHVMSERRRREKLNDSFQALRSLLPPGSKKDKASVLSSTREYLSSLRAQVAELSERNRELEARVRLNTKEEATCRDGGDVCPNNERVDVRIRQVSEATTSSSSSSEVGLVAELVVSVRGGGSVVDLVVRILEFIKRVNNVSLVSIEANHRLTDSTAVNRVVLILKVQGSEWDESGFEEAVKRVVSD